MFLTKNSLISGIFLKMLKIINMLKNIEFLLFLTIFDVFTFILVKKS